MRVERIYLDEATDWYRHSGRGDGIAVWRVRVPGDTIRVAFDPGLYDSVTLGRGSIIRREPFTDLRMSWDAQPGGWIEIAFLDGENITPPETEKTELIGYRNYDLVKFTNGSVEEYTVPAGHRWLVDRVMRISDGDLQVFVGVTIDGVTQNWRKEFENSDEAVIPGLPILPPGTDVELLSTSDNFCVWIWDIFKEVA